MPFSYRLKSAFAETPWTMGLITTNLVVWLLDFFFGVGQPMALLGGELDLAHAWRWLSYPLANPTPGGPLWLFVGFYVFYLFASTLERAWGSLRFGRVFLIITLLSATALWVASGLVQKTWQPQVIALSGIRFPAMAIFMIWASLYREQTILLMFVIPVMAKYLALATVVLAFFDPLGPLFGLPFALLFAGCWYWAGRQGNVVAARRGGGPNLRQWWKDRQRTRRKNSFQVFEGGSPMASPPRTANLHSLSKGAPKIDDAATTELDRILDKIRFEGMSALTESEKATLDSQSRRLREES